MSNFPDPHSLPNTPSHQEDENLFWQQMGLLGDLEGKTTETSPHSIEDDRASLILLAKRAAPPTSASATFSNSLMEQPTEESLVSDFTPPPTSHAIVFETESDPEDEIDSLFRSLDDREGYAISDAPIVLETPSPVSYAETSDSDQKNESKIALNTTDDLSIEPIKPTLSILEKSQSNSDVTSQSLNDSDAYFLEWLDFDVLNTMSAPNSSSIKQTHKTETTNPKVQREKWTQTEFQTFTPEPTYPVDAPVTKHYEPNVEKADAHQAVKPLLPASIQTVYRLDTSSPFEDDFKPKAKKTWKWSEENLTRSSMLASVALLVFFVCFSFIRWAQTEFVPIDWRYYRMTMMGQELKEDINSSNENATFVGTDYRFPTRDSDWTPFDWERCGCAECMRNLRNYRSDADKVRQEQQKLEKEQQLEAPTAPAKPEFKVGGNINPTEGLDAATPKQSTLGTSAPLKPGGNPTL